MAYISKEELLAKARAAVDVNDVGHFGAIDGTIDAYKQAAEYASEAECWAIKSKEGAAEIEEQIKKVNEVFDKVTSLDVDGVEGEPANAVYDKADNIIHFTIPRGEQGVKGDVGDPILATEPDGYKYVGKLDHISKLRGVEPEFLGQRILVANPSNIPNDNGGEFYYDDKDKATRDDGAIVLVTTGGKRWKRVYDRTQLLLSYFRDPGLLSESIPGENWDQAMDKLLAYSAYYGSDMPPIVFPTGNVEFKKPINLAVNKNWVLQGSGSYLTNVNFNIPKSLGYRDSAAINHFQEGTFNFKNLTLKGMCVQGLTTKAITPEDENSYAFLHGVKCRTTASLWEDVKIQNFRGTGLWLDNSFDTTFLRVGVFACGRLKDGFEYSDVANITDETKVEAFPVYIMSSRGNTGSGNLDASNFLRFQDGSFELNTVTPFVVVSSGIQIVFSRIHAERPGGSLHSNNWPLGTFCKANAEVWFDEIGVSNFTKFLSYGPYSNIFIENCNRASGSIEPYDLVTKGSGRFKVTSSLIGDMVIKSNMQGHYSFDGSQINSLQASIMSGATTLTNCTIPGNVDITAAASNSNLGSAAGVRLDNCVVSGSIKSDVNSQKVSIANSYIFGNLVLLGKDTMATGNLVKGYTIHLWQPIKDPVSIVSLGAIPQGGPIKLSTRFSTLEEAQVVFPFVTTLDEYNDWAALQWAVNNYPEIEIPAGYYRMSSPVVIPPGRAGRCAVRGQGQIGSHLQWHPINPDRSKSMFEYALVGNTGGAWGLILENLHIQGLNMVGNAIHAFNAGYMEFNNLNIEGFLGMALWFDKVQDSHITACNIQNNGYTTQTDFTNGADNSLTTHPPIWLTSTVSGDACNMVRFSGCQIEQNNVSPFVRIDGGIGLMFHFTHGEQRNSAEFNTRDMFWVRTGDVTFVDCQHDRFRNGLKFDGYGSVQITGGRSFGGLDASAAGGKTLAITANQTILGDVKLAGGALQNYKISFVDVTTKSVGVSYPTGMYSFRGCNITGDLTFTGTNSSASVENRPVIRILDNRIVGNVTVPTDIQYVQARSNYVIGNVSFNSFRGVYEDNLVVGTETLNVIGLMTSVPNMRRTNYSDTTPASGTWSVGDLVLKLTPVSGGNLGWVCVTAGTGAAAVWKTYGTIS